MAVLLVGRQCCVSNSAMARYDARLCLNSAMTSRAGSKSWNFCGRSGVNSATACWASDPNAHGVRIELLAEGSLLLPFDQFAFAELKAEGKQQRLRLVFATHEVLLRGHSLRRIETAMQRMELSSPAALPSNQRSLVAEGQPFVVEVVVTETNDAEKTFIKPKA